MVSYRPPGDSADKRQPAAAVGQPATVVLIYGSRTKGVKGANGWTRFERAPSAAQPQVHEPSPSDDDVAPPPGVRSAPGSVMASS
jgi:hypothetical protein